MFDKLVKTCIKKDYHGHLWKVDNSKTGNEARMEQLFEDIVERIHCA